MCGFIPQDDLQPILTHFLLRFLQEFLFENVELKNVWERVLRNNVTGFEEFSNCTI